MTKPHFRSAIAAIIAFAIAIAGAWYLSNEKPRVGNPAATIGKILHF